jgi:hypothetical protein
VVVMVAASLIVQLEGCRVALQPRKDIESKSLHPPHSGQRVGFSPSSTRK